MANVGNEHTVCGEPPRGSLLYDTNDKFRKALFKYSFGGKGREPCRSEAWGELKKTIEELGLPDRPYGSGRGLKERE